MKNIIIIIIIIITFKIFLKTGEMKKRRRKTPSQH